jgi:hypothetical protein
MVDSLGHSDIALIVQDNPPSLQHNLATVTQRSTAAGLYATISLTPIPSWLLLAPGYAAGLLLAFLTGALLAALGLTGAVVSRLGFAPILGLGGCVVTMC